MANFFIDRPIFAWVLAILLCLTGTLAAHAGGAPRLRGALRVTFWGAIAMAAAALVGQLFNVAG